MYARLAAGESSQGQKGRIEIGDHVHIGPQCQLAGRGGITIGSYTALAAGTKVFSATNVGDNPDDPFDLLPMSHAAPLDRQRIYEAPVVIADHVFIGLNVCILPGVKIARGAIVNSGSVVTRDVPEFAIVGGNPARIQGYRVPKIKAAPATTG
ncbi:MAG: acyltransferase [Deltaproteobacteria bacterium]|nr:acyltransferase [Deltaproteobacteria bacterium]